MDSDVERQAKTASFLSWFWLVFSTAAEEPAKAETGTDGVVFLWLNPAVLERSVVAPGTLGWKNPLSVQSFSGLRVWKMEMSSSADNGSRLLRLFV